MEALTIIYNNNRMSYFVRSELPITRTGNVPVEAGQSSTGYLVEGKKISLKDF